MPRKVIQTFGVEYLQILDEAGNVDQPLEPAIPAEDLRRLYRTMLTGRLLDKRMVSLQQQGRIGTFPGSCGHEAGIGCVYAIRPQDWYVPAYRETPALFWRGLPLSSLLMYYMGMEEANSLPPEARTLPIAISVGSQTLIAAGLAWAAKNRGDDSVVLVFFGEGATSEGDFHEACNMAGVFQMPAIFVCMNNQYAISVPRTLQTHSETIAQKAIAYGFPGIQVDGNDVLAMYAATRDAVDRARKGQGPTLIEGLNYRLSPHTTADDPRRYRSDAELAEWQRRDPVLRFRIYLERKKLWTAAWQEQLEAEIKTEIEEAVRKAESQLGAADPLEMFDHVYSELSPDLQAQRDQAAEALGRTRPAPAAKKSPLPSKAGSSK
jgi:pyruvate dehydrogenase E1 component alpha subunit